MVCQIPAPRWEDSSRPGLQSAIENLADSTIVLTWGDALPVFPATSVHYLIYYSPSVSTLFDAPKLVTTETTVAIPTTVANLTQYFAVRVAQLGVADPIDATTLTAVNTDADVYSLADSTLLRLDLGVADGYIAVDSTAGFPLTDGYVKVEDEVIFYSNLDTFMSGPAFQIADRDPFNCNTVVTHTADGYIEAELFGGFNENNSVKFKAVEACGLPRPEWDFWQEIGIQSVNDLGIGTSVELAWNTASAPVGFGNIYYNVYRGSSLYSLTIGQPFGITENQTVIDPNLHPGDGYYYTVRAAYFINNLTLPEFTNISGGFYAYPDTTTINEGDGYFSVNELGTLEVLSTTGFPSSGILKIASEALTYDSLTATTFNITERDTLGSDVQVEYPNGTAVDFFKGVEDLNAVFYRTTPSWDSHTTPILLPLVPGDGYDGYQYLQDSDGYRSFPFDNVNEDHEDFENNNDDVDPQSYCGLRSDTFVELYQKTRCGTFQGGSNVMTTIPGVNGGNPVRVGGGIDVFGAALQREEFLLGLTGEPFILLSRKGKGKACARLSHRHEHPHARCSLCFGTTFEGGYDRFVNARELRPGEVNPNGFIQLRVQPYGDKAPLKQDLGIDVSEVLLETWTLALPSIKVRDMLIKYTSDIEFGFLEEEFRYEVVNVQRNKLLFGKEGAQKITLKRLAKSEMIYSFPRGGIILV
jgi:hypothetical protein